MMEEIRIFVEKLIALCGITGASVPVIRHAALLVVAVLLAWLSDYLCRKIFVPIVAKFSERTDAKWVRVIFNRQVLVAACHIIPGIIIWEAVPMVFYQYPVVREILQRLTSIYIVILSVHLITRIINAFSILENKKASSTQQYLKSFCGIIKIIVIFIAVIIVVAILINRNPLTLLAGLGATSAILMLIFKDTITGLVDGIRLTSNDMLHKGDWITVAGTGADGVVEEITLSTVKIRNSDNTIFTVSPQSLMNGAFQNWEGMHQSGGRRIKRVIYFDFHSIKIVDDNLHESLINKGYFKAEEIKNNEINMSLFRKYAEQYLSKHSEVNAQMLIMVRQLEATYTGLPIELYFFVKEKNSPKYDRILADIMENVYAIAPDFGLTIYQQTPKQAINE